MEVKTINYKDYNHFVESNRELYSYTSRKTPVILVNAFLQSHKSTGGSIVT